MSAVEDLKHLTSADLAAIRLRDSAVKIFTDRFGGRFVLRADGRHHGQHAIMDRRRLLEHIDTLAALTLVAKDMAALPITVISSRRECGWVIEAPTPGNDAESVYLWVPPAPPLVASPSAWTPDVEKAMRFAREGDVRAFMRTSALSAVLVRPKFFEKVTPC